MEEVLSEKKLYVQNGMNFIIQCAIQARKNYSLCIHVIHHKRSVHKHLPCIFHGSGGRLFATKHFCDCGYSFFSG